MAWDCFISYASQDLAIAERLHSMLCGAGFAVWFDKVRLAPGYDWHREIEHGCESSRIVVPILTPRWKSSEWTRFETYGAEWTIPVLAEGAWNNVATPPLERFHYFELETPPDALTTAIREHLAQPQPEKAPRLANLKYRPNPYFVGRDNTLTRIHEGLHRRPSAALTQGRVEAIVALGGVGKTTIAREYAEKFWRVYHQMFWVDCRNGLEREFAGILESLGGGIATNEMKEPEAAAAALRELNRPRESVRLLVMDNAEDEDSVRRWIPATGSCHTLITSRFSTWSPGVETHPVTVLDSSDARALLSRRADRHPSDPGCEELARRLGYLPLALEQAAAFVRRQGTGFGFTEYLRLYAAAEQEFLANVVRGSTEYPDAVLTTWRTTIDRLPAGAVAMLRLSAFLAPAPISFGMFLAGADILAEQAAAVAGTPKQAPTEFEIREWRGALADYSMITAQPDDSFSVHPLVQAVERSQVIANAREQWIKQAVRLIWAYAPTPSDSLENGPAWKRLLPHAAALAIALEPMNCAGIASALLDETAKYMAARGDYTAAEPLLRRALTASERELGAENYSTLSSMNNLAVVLSHKGDYAQADILMRRVFEIRSRRLGNDHLDTLTSAANLGDVLFRQGNYAAAEPLIRRSLESRERILGPHHPATLGALNNLAVLLKSKGDYAAAKPLYRRTLEGFERVHGADHPATLQALNNLGNLMRNTMDLETAEDLLRRALQGRERVLGPEHPVTLSSAMNLAQVLSERGRHSDAEVLFRTTLEALDRTLGRSHPITLTGMMNLGAMLTNAGKYDEAEDILKIAAGALAEAFGPEHPNTITVRANLGAVLVNKGDKAGGSRVFRSVLPVAERVLGKNHPVTLMIRENLGL